MGLGETERAEAKQHSPNLLFPLVFSLWRELAVGLNQTPQEMGVEVGAGGSRQGGESCVRQGPRGVGAETGLRTHEPGFVK